MDKYINANAHGAQDGSSWDDAYTDLAMTPLPWWWRAIVWFAMKCDGY